MEDKPVWVCVVDNDPVSQQQKKIVKELKPKDSIMGFLECDKMQNSNSETCATVEYFPAFCHSVNKMCVYGIRKQAEDFAELTKMSQK